jgi:hypothetical protein
LYHPNWAVRTCQNGRQGKLPKWQKAGGFCQNGSPQQILCQTAPSKYHAKQKNIFLRFSLFLFFDNADI